MIDLSTIDANTVAAGDQAFAFIGTSSFNGLAGELRYAQSGGNTFVQGDVDGNGTADIEIQLTGLITINAGDFVL